MKKFTLSGKLQMIEAIRYIEELPLEPVMEVVVREKTKNKRAAQHGLQWLWNTEIGKHLGNTKEEMHEILKEKFAINIFIRDDKDYAAMVEAVKAVRRQGMNNEANTLRKKIVDLTSTMDFSVKQAAEYLTSMEHFAADVGAEITFPKDLYFEALGRQADRGRR